MPDTTPNTDPTGTQTSWLDSAIGNVASWVNHVVSGTPTAGQLQATSASLDAQLANGTNQADLTNTINGNPTDPVDLMIQQNSGGFVGNGTYSGVNTAYAPGGAIYQQIYATQGPAAADAAWANEQGIETLSAQQTAAIPGQIGQAAEDGAQQGLDNVVSAAQGLPGKILGLLGYQWILLVLVVAFFWLGGAVFLRNKLAKK